MAYVILSKDHRCHEKVTVKELNQCAHEILFRGWFDPSYFIDRHFSQDCVKGSLSDWNACNDNYVGDLLGYEDEVIDKDGALINHDEQTYLTDQMSNMCELPTILSVCVKPLAKKTGHQYSNCSL